MLRLLLHQGLHGPDVKDPAGPEHHRCRQQQLQPAQSVRGEARAFKKVAARQHVPHGNDDQRHGEDAH